MMYNNNQLSFEKGGLFIQSSKTNELILQTERWDIQEGEATALENHRRRGYYEL